MKYPPNSSSSSLERGHEIELMNFVEGGYLWSTSSRGDMPLRLHRDDFSMTGMVPKERFVDVAFTPFTVQCS